MAKEPEPSHGDTKEVDGKLFIYLYGFWRHETMRKNELGQWAAPKQPRQISRVPEHGERWEDYFRDTPRGHFER